MTNDELQTLSDAEIFQIVENWIQELRSGNWKQCKNTIKGDDGFCCIGVLQETQFEKIFENEWDKTRNDGYDNINYIIDRIFVEKSEIKNWFWFADMNDEMEMAFPQIADKIEKVLKNVKAQG